MKSETKSNLKTLVISLAIFTAINVGGHFYQAREWKNYEKTEGPTLSKLSAAVTLKVASKMPWLYVVAPGPAIATINYLKKTR